MKTKARILMAIKIWIVIYPSITLFLFLFGTDLAAFPLYQRTFFLTISLVPWMVFIGIPFIDFVAGQVFRSRLSKNEGEK
ncbi:hypothetical protein [Desertivirga brevis]|uniref:hypothetical protein n=1 Tax=Desertivirga brevis TaxID=2810310 RepID=UPI001A97533C|nr:hypothetical protein [Pedobacter sp. SYSU D00873]